MRAATVGVLAALCLAGCHAEPEKASPVRAAGPDLDAELARGRAEGRLLLVLATEEGRSPADAAARALLADAAVRARAEKWITVDLDLAVSRSRAAATRFHPTNTPLLLCVSSRGVIVSRDEGVTKESLLERLDAAERAGPELDRKLDGLEAAANAGAADDCMRLAEFLVAQKNAREAIPHLEAVRRAEGADPSLRARAAVEEARAHYWAGEPEKGRHVAEELIATLGASSPEALAAGYFVLGAQDAQGRHKDTGLRELDQAIAAAPDSVWGQRARDERAKLAPERK